MRNMDVNSTTIAEVFRRNGYATGLFGKWHLGQSERYGPWFRGFDETLTAEGDNQRSHFDPVLLQNRKPVPFEGYRTDVLFDEAIDFMKRHQEEPFFCYLPTYTPHAPLKVPEQYIEPYKHLDPQIAAYYGMVAQLVRTHTCYRPDCQPCYQAMHSGHRVLQRSASSFVPQVGDELLDGGLILKSFHRRKSVSLSDTEAQVLNSRNLGPKTHGWG
ncbi:hypothetical protein DDZ13_05885 [Coraliomargarita sinensis]|uniref:Sulfatase N-terminal domain-containing protein n=1 Tax=Coraliomargarita sinensis TaxID=2174842 RepID=A0A317ZGY1_9BACT|nr:hypothetical protein DDZ13_05885 [Coraliomargarita sinensis]